jgi:protein N-terminal methyltransferase
MTSESSIDEGVAPDAQIKHADSIKYWDSVTPDVNGMLGGYPQISRIDLRGSKNFVNKLRRLSEPQGAPQGKLKRAVDCGAGIGRVTEGCLSLVAETVDIVEPVEHFVTVLKTRKSKEEGIIGDIFAVGLESWTPENTYDLIWNQWCVGHLTDSQFVAYLKRCGKALSKGGWIVVKENLSTHTYGEDIFDDLDSSVTRSDQKFRDLIAQAGLHVVKSELQTGFPKGLGLLPVRFYALQVK